ncbi:hypothetical protein G7Z17_g8025 [Cylindrodendrum hubeiense]|uniref:FAD-binding domain-containing protein n=1 Tax=Cylindrodendrum hubeiense TaxID=595255 RepID=A0A9P5H6R6_9HYPO|nr:hypothetical protein G7Z17_g8025 [Cylindrodendrum hubeiense]
MSRKFPDTLTDGSSGTPKFQVAIVGGGISGLVTAIALLKHPGVSIQIYERAKEFKEIGASIGLGPNGLRSLEKLGVENALSGDALLDNVPRDIIHLGKETIDIEANGNDGVIIHFKDSTSKKADICIGADGIHSNVRKTFVPTHTLHWTGWVALRATFEASRLNDLDFPQDAAHWIGHDRNFFHSHLGKGLFTAVGGFHVDPSSPNAPGRDAKWNGLGSLEQFKEFYKDWNPTIMGFIEACPSIRLFPNFAGSALERWSFNDRVTLVGDAAHTHGGAFAAGGSLAIDDAYALYLALNHVWPASTYRTEKPTKYQISEIFRIYEATRKPHINKILGVVHKAIAGQKADVKTGETETEEQLRQRVLQRMDPEWISEHDVEAAFQEIIGKIGVIQELHEPRHRL